MRQIWTLGVLAGTCCLSSATPLARANAGVSTAFTYQGQLRDGGSPANGAYDFDFRLYDAVTNGAQIGVDVLVNDLNVSSGLFTTSLDFGNVFNGGALWLEISVRSGASAGAYTTLTPRQPLTAAPYAMFALNDANWHQSGTALTNSNTGFVGINRATAQTSAEYFGVHVPVSTGYGGMYINTDAGNTKPFYGYMAGANTAWTELDGSSQNWNVHNGGNTRLTVASNGRVGVGLTVPAEALDVNGNARATNFNFSSSQTRTLSVPPEAFHPQVQTDSGLFGGSAGETYLDSGAGTVQAPVYLPNGATITGLTLVCIDNSGANLSCDILSRAPAADGYNFLLEANSSGANANVRSFSVSGASVVDSTLCYTVTVYCSAWAGPATIVKGVQVTYIVDHAD